MAEATLHHLAEAPAVSEILAADINLSRSKAVLARIPNRKKIRSIQIDITDTAASAHALKGSSCVINCSWYEFNLKAMDVSLALKAHYVDLGGLYHMTLKQLSRFEEFKRAKTLAILGIGSAPGISNMMTALITKDFNTIDTIGIYDASFDPILNGKSFLPPFSIKTLLDEHKQKAPVLLGGKLKEVPAHSLPEELEFKAPIGRAKVGAVIHSEVATLPQYLKSKKIKNLFFKIAYPATLKPQLELLEAMGFSRVTPIRLNGRDISPKAFLAELARPSATKITPQGAEDFEVLRVKAVGVSKGCALEKILDCEMRGKSGLSAGTLGVGIPAAIAALMILNRKTLISAGVAAPEATLNQDVFFKALRASGAFQFVETQIKTV
jgi:saccharopine dehydrogenase-like NADP-dependent oxidoreductase